MNHSQWVEIARGAADVAQVVAIVVGAVWAYFKFVRSRTFANRLELDVEGLLLGANDDSALIVTSTLRNRGLVRVRLNERGKSAYVYGVSAGSWRPEEAVEWGKHLRVEGIFAQHEWIEAQEVITDRILVPLVPPLDDEDQWLAVRVKAVVANKRQKLRRRSVSWTAEDVVPGAFTELRHGDEELTGGVD